MGQGWGGEGVWVTGVHWPSSPIRGQHTPVSQSQTPRDAGRVGWGRGGGVNKYTADANGSPAHRRKFPVQAPPLPAAFTAILTHLQSDWLRSPSVDTVKGHWLTSPLVRRFLWWRWGWRPGGVALGSWTELGPTQLWCSSCTVLVRWQ